MTAKTVNQIDTETVIPMKEGTFDLGIPIPKRTYNSGKYHFGEMPINASFALPKKKEQTLRTSALLWKKNHPGWNYTVRTLTENGQRVVRIWRTA